MSVTVDVVDDPNVRVTDQAVEALPPDAVEFAVEGTVSVGADLLGAFGGRRLRPVAVGLSADDEAVTVDLGGDASLRLDAVDVGMETPDAGDLPASKPDAGSLTDDVAEGVAGAADRHAGVVAFTVEGRVRDVPPDTFEALAGKSLRVETVTFAVDDAPVTDGGAGDDVVLEFTLLGHRIAIRRDGTVAVVIG